MPRSLAWLLVLALLGAFGAVTFVLLRQRSAEGKGLPDYSAFSDGADGLGEAAHFLRQAGWTPVAVTRPIQHTGRSGLLVVAEPTPPGPFGGGGLGEADARALLSWVEQGNTVLLVARKNTPLHQALGVLVTEGPPGEEDQFL